MKSENGMVLSNYLGNNSKLTATTISAQSDRLVCKINLSLTYAGSTQKIRGRFIYREFAGGKTTVQFIPH
ncbi:MAG: hypothetical protein JWQ89_2141 [Devosia sp.]|uniref:hypothetical protein n=1 Tax=Devosia sp. TaxID=1871048 RepID=UPI00260C00DC|nr:hypothetical protein [Devosia sp.]MDB5540414.1 hypothetical protein [Devosia sp.]